MCLQDGLRLQLTTEPHWHERAAESTFVAVAVLNDISVWRLEMTLHRSGDVYGEKPCWIHCLAVLAELLPAFNEHAEVLPDQPPGRNASGVR